MQNKHQGGIFLLVGVFIQKETSFKYFSVSPLTVSLCALHVFWLKVHTSQWDIAMMLCDILVYM